jgi:hypothetical protein
MNKNGTVSLEDRLAVLQNSKYRPTEILFEEPL